MAVDHVLRQIRDAARAMQQPETLSNLHPIEVPRLPQLTISLSPSISPQLAELGLPSALVQEISDAYHRASDQLRDSCESSLRRAIQDLASKGLLAVEKVHLIHRVWSATYTKQAAEWAEKAICRARQISPEALVSSKKPAFNHEYTPLLEKYFEYNAYPSAADRSVLARKSMMTPRQIEVWFQNHRNRARKDGKRLRKMANDPLPIQLSLESLEQKMPFFTIPKCERKSLDKLVPSDDDSSDDESYPPMLSFPRDASARDELNAPAPLHAFPMPYPPRCDYNPFLTPTKFPAPVWYRKPATRRLVAPAIDFEDLILDFSLKLILREPPSRKERGKAPDAPWFAWRHTVPSPAPHPALVQTSGASTLSHALSILLTIPAPSTRLHPFRSPSPCAQPATLIPPQHQTSPPTRRKVARLPNRTPKNPSTTHRRGSPAISEASPSPSSRSLSSNSRSSSSGSDTPSKRRPSSSSSSSSSSPPSALTTPTLPHATLPDDTRSPTVSVAGLDFQNMDDLFGDSSSALSPIEGLPLDFHAVAHQKPGFNFSIELPTAGLLQQRS